MIWGGSRVSWIGRESRSFVEVCRRRVRPGSAGTAERLDAETAHDVDRVVACGGSSTTTRVRHAKHCGRFETSMLLGCFSTRMTLLRSLPS